jgi:hypothetical protein
VCAHFVPHLLMPDQKHQRAASSVEFVEMTNADRNVLEKTVKPGPDLLCIPVSYQCGQYPVSSFCCKMLIR